MVESIYAKCEKCGEGVLLPFFDYEGKNAYGCTSCGVILKPDKLDIFGSTKVAYSE